MNKPPIVDATEMSVYSGGPGWLMLAVGEHASPHMVIKLPLPAAQTLVYALLGAGPLFVQRGQAPALSTPEDVTLEASNVSLGGAAGTPMPLLTLEFGCFKVPALIPMSATKPLGELLLGAGSASNHPPPTKAQ
jgi:hypothetical protein